MRQLTLMALTLLLLLVAACGGGGATSTSDQGNPPPPAQQQAAGALALNLEATQNGTEWRVDLRAPSAADLYQIAGTLRFDPLRYEFVAVEAGGDLGMPDDSYFLGRESSPGRVDFAYTRRYHGPGRNGNLRLISLRVRALNGFNIGDFTLDETPERLRARDSKRGELRCNLQPGVQR